MKYVNQTVKVLQFSDIQDSFWDGLVESSMESSPFLMSKFLRSVGNENSRVVMLQNESPIVAGCLIHPNSVLQEEAFAYSIYQGVFFPGLKRDSYSGENHALKRMGLFMEWIDGLKEPQQLSLSPKINDLRAIDWFYFKNENRNLKFEILTRYTGQIRIKEFSCFEDYLKSIQKARLREYEISLKLNLKIDLNSTKIDDFLELYHLTFNRQGLSVTKSLAEKCRRIMNDAIKYGYGRLMLLYGDEGKAVCGVFILSNELTDIYLFGASDLNYRNCNPVTRLLLDSIKDSFSKSKEIFDFCGMNSPSRGYFKSTFNSRVTPYFEIKLREKEN